MARYLKITNGTTTVHLDGTSAAAYFNDRESEWVPAIATRDSNVLAGNIHTNVQETIPLLAKSSTDTDTLLDNIRNLNNLIEQAGRWAIGENVDPVIIRYSPTSDTDYLEAVILGPPPGQSAIELPLSFEQYLTSSTIVRINLSFIRRGLWIDATDETQTSSSASISDVHTVTWGDSHDIPSPVDIKIDYASTYASANPAGYLLYGTEANDVRLLDNGTVTTDASKIPYGTYIERTNFTADGWTNIGYGRSPVTSCKVFSVFVVVRKSLGAAAFRLRARVTVGTRFIDTREVVYGEETTNIATLFLGNISMPYEVSSMDFDIQANFIDNGSSPDFEIDRMASVVADKVGCGAIHLLQGALTNNDYFQIEHKALEEIRPQVTVTNTTPDTDTLGYTGALSAIAQVGNKMSALFIGNDPSYWQPVQGGAAPNVTIAFTRNKGYLVPK